MVRIEEKEKRRRLGAILLVVIRGDDRMVLWCARGRYGKVISKILLRGTFVANLIAYRSFETSGFRGEFPTYTSDTTQIPLVVHSSYARQSRRLRPAPSYAEARGGDAPINGNHKFLRTETIYHMQG